MTDAYVQVAVDGAGKKVDTSEIEVSDITVERQRIVLADDSDAEGLAAILKDGADARDYGLVTREVPGGDDANLTHQLLFQILTKLDELVTLHALKG